MNITELARKLKIPTQELREKIPELGFDIGEKAIQVDDLIAKKIMEMWHEHREREKMKNISKNIETQEKPRPVQKQTDQPQKTVDLPKIITVNDLADKLNLSIVKIISELMKNGIMATINDHIDYETAAIISEDLGFKPQLKEETDIKIQKINVKEMLSRGKTRKNLQPRPPIVTIMGHIDHGKTTLLDTIRKTHVTQSEKGGITQHITAYQVVVPQKESKSSSKTKTLKNRTITFIDTPGHAAFKQMRSRGGIMADIAILIVAAEEGLKPQTLESIKIIQEENLMMLVAINKIDKPEADIDRVKKQLAEINLTPEDWGGKTICVPISAKSGQGIDDLLDMILLLADMEKEKIVADPAGQTLGTVIESNLDKHEGPTAIVLIHNGTLRKNDIISVGKTYGKIKFLRHVNGQEIEQALPGTPVKILGLKAAPQAGDILEVSLTQKDLKRKNKNNRQRGNFEQILSVKTSQKDNEQKKESLNLVLKADVMGSLEALEEALSKIGDEEIKLNIIKRGLGQINETDILRAEVEHGLAVGFHTQISPSAELLAKEKGVQIKTFDVIYKLIDEIKGEMNKLLKPEIKQIETGKLKVLEIFRTENNIMILGGQVQDGKIQKGNKCLVLREEKEICLGKITGLQKGKRETDEVRMGEECGLKFEGKPLVQKDDILRTFEEVKQEIKIIE